MRQTQLDKNELIITHNKDRKQTKYGNKRWEHVTHAADDRLLLYSIYDDVFLFMYFTNLKLCESHCLQSEWTDKFAFVR